MEKSICFSILLLLSFVAPALSATINVPADQTTIGAAVTAASAGDTIVVAAGTYSENVFINKNLTLQGAGASTCTINGGGSNFTISIPLGTVNITGFTITNGTKGLAVGSISTNANVTVSDCTITANSGNFGVGVSVTGSILTMSDCTVSNNTATAESGAGINALNSTVTITDSIISGNTATNGSGGGINLTNSTTATITNSTISNNSAPSTNSTISGGGIRTSNSTATITGCTISSNTTGSYGGGIRAGAGSTITVTGSTISDNTADGEAGGIKIENSTAAIDRCTISNNDTLGSGGSIFFNDEDSGDYTLTVTNCLLTNNTATNGAAIYLNSNDTSTTMSITNCTIADNTDGGGGSILVGPASSINATITNCIITNATSYGIVDVSSNPISTMVNNNFYGNSTAPYATTLDLVSVTTYTVTQINNISSPDSSGNISGDPLFVSSTDYSLQSLSPCIDTGTSTGAPSEDINGTTRPQSTATDIGAYEYVAAYVPGYVWYFAEGCTNGFDEWIMVQNLGASAASLTFTFYYSDLTTSGSLTYTTSVPAERRLSLHVNNLASQTTYADLANKDIATKVESTNSVKIAVDRAMYWPARQSGGDADDTTWIGSHCSIGSPLPSTTWYFPEGSTSTAKNFQQWFLLFNPNSTAATVTLTFQKTDGTTSTLSTTVSATERTTVKVNSTMPDQNFATQITSDETIVAERAMYWDAGGVTQYGGHCSTGSTTTNDTWYFAEGTSRTGFDEFILLQNPTSTDSEVTLTFMKTDGTTETATKTIPATGRATVDVNSDVPALVGFDHSVTIATTNSVEFVAERAIYKDYGTVDWAAGHCSIGSTNPSTTWYLPEGSTAGNFDEFILLQNPGSTAATVTLTYLSESTTAVTATTTVGATSRKTVDPSVTIPSGHFSTKIESTEDIVAERAMYWSSKNAHCSIGLSD